MDGVIGPHTILDRLQRLGTVLAIKLYRLPLEPAPPVPILPCLDHEAMLHEGIDPHMAVYLEERQTRELHELVFIPARQRIEVDTVSTLGESSDDTRRRLMTELAVDFPGWRITVSGLSWWRGDRRVADACRAQVLLRDVLLSHDIAGMNARISRLQAVGSLMEKQGRVASWGVRTVTGPLLPAAAGTHLPGDGLDEPSLQRCHRHLVAVRRGRRAWRRVPLLRAQGGAAHGDVEPGVEARSGIRADSDGAEAIGSVG